MSHFVTIKTQIKDIEALEAACAELGFAFEQDAQARGIDTEQRGQYVIRLSASQDNLLDSEVFSLVSRGGFVSSKPALAEFLNNLIHAVIRADYSIARRSSPNSLS